MGLFREPAFDTPCRIAVEQSEAHFHAHVELDGDIAIQPGDKVRVHGAPIIVGFGESILIQRMATVQPAGALMRAWTRCWPRVSKPRPGPCIRTGTTTLCKR